MRLARGDRVVIVGGGPAGSFAALHLARLSSKMQLDLELQVFEPRDFNRPGPGGCNQCAGILSSPLLAGLEDLALKIPPDVIQAKLHTYVLHLGDEEIPIYQPDPSRRIMSIYRGSGPLAGKPPYPRSFDGWLLEQAKERGVAVKQARVEKILRGKRPTIVTATDEVEADLVVVATGINRRSPLEAAWRYRPPGTEVMAQNEIVLPRKMINNSVHIYFEHPAGLVFGGVIPKGRYANISLLGQGLSKHSAAEFLEDPNLGRLWPEEFEVLCHCTPRVAVSPAAGGYHDRMVVVGDAAVTRLYKDGIGSAMVTARAAVETALCHGISREAFRRHFQPACRTITMDNYYGQALFRLWALSKRTPKVLNIWRQVLLAETDLPAAQQIHRRALWSMFTGDMSYRKIFMQMLNLPTFWTLAREAVKIWKWI